MRIDRQRKSRARAAFLAYAVPFAVLLSILGAGVIIGIAIGRSMVVEAVAPIVKEPVIFYEQYEQAQVEVPPEATESIEVEEPPYTKEELDILALIIYQEAGGDACSDETRLMVGCVFMNRVEDDRFPDTFYEVATQERQYGRLHWTGLEWPARAELPQEARAIERAYDIAERVLDGERVLPADVIFQSEHILGEIVAEQDGFYFCK